MSDAHGVCTSQHESAFHWICTYKTWRKAQASAPRTHIGATQQPRRNACTQQSSATKAGTLNCQRCAHSQLPLAANAVTMNCKGCTYTLHTTQTQTGTLNCQSYASAPQQGTCAPIWRCRITHPRNLGALQRGPNPSMDLSEYLNKKRSASQAIPQCCCG